MDCCIGMFKNLFTFGSSLFDLGSDLINSLDFLGYNATSQVSETIADASEELKKLAGISYFSDNDVLNTTNFTATDGIQAVHQIWGRMGIGCIFLPGVIMLPAWLYLAGNGDISNKLWGTSGLTRCRRTFLTLLVLFAMLLYPISLIFFQIVTLLFNCSNARDGFKAFAMGFVAMEAFF